MTAGERDRVDTRVMHVLTALSALSLVAYLALIADLGALTASHRGVHGAAAVLIGAILLLLGWFTIGLAAVLGRWRTFSASLLVVLAAVAGVLTGQIARIGAWMA